MVALGDSCLALIGHACTGLGETIFIIGNYVHGQEFTVRQCQSYIVEEITSVFGHNMMMTKYAFKQFLKYD